MVENSPKRLDKCLDLDLVTSTSGNLLKNTMQEDPDVITWLK
jgi:hypothetical protein